MTTNDRLGRRSRHTPQSTGKRITLQPRDRLWLVKLAAHGPLPSSFLLQYATDSHKSDKRAGERLTDLFHEDDTADGGAYLTRPPQQFRTLDSRYNQLVYDLAPAGWKALGRKRPARAGPWLHQHFVSCITASVELATLQTENIQFLSQSYLLERAEAELRCTVPTINPATGRTVQKDLIPDALFGLKYHTPNGPRFRCFVMEADRGTEPATSKNFNRKSVERSLEQYEAYIGAGRYKEHLKLKAPLLVLNVSTSAKRQELMQKVVSRKGSAQAQAFMLFQTWEAFGEVYKPPNPNAALLNSQWERTQFDSLKIAHSAS